MKKNLKILILIIFFFSSQQSNTYASIENKIIMNVGNTVVTSYELKNKIKTVLFLNDQNLSQKNIDLAKNGSIQSLINYKIKKEKIIKFNIQMDDYEGVNKVLMRVYRKYNTDRKGLRKIFEQNNLDFEFYLEEINTELAWQKLVLQLFRKKITISDEEINNELDLITKNQKKVKEYELAEIEIFYSNEDDKMKKIQQIKNEINKNNFEDTAKKYSASSSSVDGGKMGWVNSTSLSPQIQEKLKYLKPGDISQPIISANSFIFLKLLNAKNLIIDEIDKNKLKEKIIINKQNNLLNLYSNNYLSKIKNNTLIEMR